MKIFEFEIIIEETITNEIANDIYCVAPDTTCSVEYTGVSHIEFDRKSESLVEAVASAMQDVIDIGLTIETINIG